MLTSRRDFIKSSAAAGGLVLGLEGLALRGTMACTPGAGEHGVETVEGSYGPLSIRPAANTGESLIALPDGFEYNVFGRTGDPLSDGHATPPNHDGMAAFAVGDEWRLVRNHEIKTITPGKDIPIGTAARSWDVRSGGGTTTLVIDPKTRLPVRAFVSLSGTNTNCAGGHTPWGSWISCEEVVVGTAAGFHQDHGYCFEVPAESDGEVEPVPLRAMGRFVHEAVAVDPGTGHVYETEDALSAGCYRFIPREPGHLAAGGRLQMLAIDGRPGYDTRTGQRQGTELPVVWVDIPDADPASATIANQAVYNQGRSRGGATFGRLEGCFWGNGKIYLNATSGGEAHAGQVWQYTPDGDRGTLMLLFESPRRDVLNMPDNLCVSPRGGLVICEDGDGVQHMRGLTKEGRIFDFARNAIPRYENREWAGSTFSPDGSTLFVNIQAPGVTFAIWGPWDRGAL